MAVLLREHEISQKFRSLKKSAGETLIAVPFWGTGAITELGLDTGQVTRVICNLLSGACNPYVIEEAMALPGVSVRSNPCLHAKIYASKGFAIVGSSNASSNGLAIAGDAPTGWIEANVLSTAPALVKQTCELFEDIWNSKSTIRIRPKILNHAKTIWNNRPKTTPPLRANTLLAACRDRPDLFSSVFVVIYEEEISPEASQKFSRFKQQVRGPAAIDGGDFRKAWAYQLETEIAPGSWLLDFDYRNHANPQIRGCSQVPTPPLRLKINDEPDVTITLRQPVRLPGSSRSLPIAASEKCELIANANKIFACEPELVPLSKAIDILDRAARRRR